jgi:hypothetical protein
MVVDKLGTTFAALSDPTRRAMNERFSRGPASVHGTTEPFALSQQMISKNIAYLVRARIVGAQLCGWNAVEYLEIVLHEKIVSSMYFSDSKGNKVDPAELGIEHEAIDGAYDVTLFEDLGNGQTKLTFIGNDPMECSKNSGQMEAWIEILDKVAAVVAELSHAK